MESCKFAIALTLLACCLLPACSIIAAQDRGITGFDPARASQPLVSSPVEQVLTTTPLSPAKSDHLSPWSRHIDDWELIAADSIEVFVPDGEYMAIFFDPTTESLGFVDPTEELSAVQMAAIERAPAWLRADLYDNFTRFLYSFQADPVAQEILDAPDPYVDEIAFQAAHIAPGVLGCMFLQLLLENARGIYSADSVLDYVEIVDYGDSNDDDYYSTALYRVIEESGDTVNVEVDRETYYWYIVHPKLSDEMPTYINPANGQEAAPPTGVFWRDYLWNHADPGYPLLSEQFEGCEFLWAHLTNTAGPANGAVGEVNDWINSVMTFGAGAERPIQPVRIYVLHCGNCGEFSDITAAAGRIALIPTICTTNYCEDHTWNEFWDREWIAWEPVNTYVNSPLVYENGWGKVISAVFNWRGDGYVWTVTDRYSEGVCTLNVTIYDALGKPADGQVITIQSDAIWGGYYDATWGITNSLGQASIILGDNQDFQLRIEGPLGSYPAFGTVSVITNSQAGAVYEWEHTMSMSSPDLEISQAPDYPNPLDTYLMEIEYECEYETAYGSYFNNNEFAKKMDTGLTDFFIVNQGNYVNYVAFLPAQGFAIEEDVSSGSVSYTLPTDETWYAVFSSRELCKNYPRIRAAVNIYRNSAAAKEAPSTSLPASYSLSIPYPNPFNSATAITFATPFTENVKIAIHNLLGQQIAVIADDFYAPGVYTIQWNGRTDEGNPVASGTYIVKMTSGKKRLIQKVCFMQ